MSKTSLNYKLKNKIALITGAASGIGKATAKLFAREGAIVVVTDINCEGGTNVTEEIENAGGRALFLRLDVREELDWQNAITEIENRYSKLNILVNNAGISTGGPISEVTLEEWRDTIAVNLDGTFLGTKFGISLIKKTEGGSIINLGSISSLVGSSMAAAYCASKGGVRLFTKAMALECAKFTYPIRVNSICPGIVGTDIWGKSNWWPDFVKLMGSEQAAWNHFSQATPIGRIATTEEIAKGILFLASDDSSFMTGSEFVVDGGLTAQ